ncbi:thioesterase II family protein [Embleya hyalina]|uniref:Thioesterase n=1 Tax=Embleya hyalina TaxID=516124 RepID=A0A401Z2N7_9ACTN|nr:alpha/beta fold hydrolase [Embleya hyalina]GCE01099.1 thioesterase [Embleya hyalina]
MTAATTGTGAWVRRFHAASASGARLVCFPHAGGAASFFFPVSRQLAPELDVLAIQYPGRQDRRREPCVEDIGTLADRLTAELLPLADRPLAFFGHSMGAVIAFEVTRRLEEKGVSPLVLFASGRRSPSSVREESVHRAGDRALIAELQRLDGTDARMLDDPELLRMILPTLRSDYKAVETYRCRPPEATVGCPVVALIGDADPHVTREEGLRWKEHTRGPFDMHVFDGGHFYLNTHAASLMQIIVEQVRDNSPTQ